MSLVSVRLKEPFPAGSGNIIYQISCTFSQQNKDLKGGLTGSMKEYLIPLIALLVGFAIAFPAGIVYRKKVAEAELGSAEEEAKRVLSDAIKTAESKKREALVEAKDEIFKLRSDADREIKDRRNEVHPPGAAPAAAGGEPGQEERKHGEEGGAACRKAPGGGRPPGRGRRGQEAASLSCWKRSPAIPQTRPRTTCSRTLRTN